MSRNRWEVKNYLYFRMNRERELRQELKENRERCFFGTGMKFNRALRNLDSCIRDVQDIGPLQPRNREVSAILEDLREVRTRLSQEYSRLVDKNTKNSK